MASSAADCNGVTVTAGTESFRVTGRAAVLIGLVAAHADRINALAVGKVVANVAQRQVKLELVESLPAVRLEG